MFEYTVYTCIKKILLQTNLHLSREISDLKAQLLEMKKMMKISFDLQMDIQRSIRQEVAAGIAAASGG
ncbi:hypothetical protein DPMN_164836 [Dreissena polymorpha]|uniref:Uncharacterized protein n=1 Tax=Dreissena polymorpha TaxID=45954 RepID=A0A9D4IW02_DREPO|nr:hypothetical protein DPMN_164836 [Dreissena polymorpha]